MLAAALNESSREALSVTAAVLVAVALGFIFQGRVVDEQVHAPDALRARLVAVEVLAAGIFFVAAAVGVYSCLYYLTIDRIPIGADRKIIEHALLTSAVVGFLSRSRAGHSRPGGLGLGPKSSRKRSASRAGESGLAPGCASAPCPQPF